MKIWISSLLVLFAFYAFAGGDSVATIQVKVGDGERSQTPVSVSLENLPVNSDSGELQLYLIRGGKRELIPCQLVSGYAPRLFWIIDQADANETLTYELAKGKAKSSPAPIQVNVDERRILLSRDGKNILQYNSAEIYPPDGVAQVYKRSGFIHPLWSPDAHVLTRIQPPDHRHHYGIWGPWTKTHIKGREVDFWNLAKGQGTVRFAGLLSKIEGPVFSGFKVRQEHIDFGAAGSDKTAMNEVLDIRAWNISSTVRLVDYTITLNCPADSILLDAYRYGGGIGFRAAESWTNENSRVLTSEGKTRVDADGSFARWCDVSGESENGKRAGIVFMSHPNNKSHPEPMRVWPVDANRGRGDMFFEFCPIRHESWLLSPGRDYVLRYRLLVYDGKVDPQTSERAWQNFAHPPTAQIMLK